MTKSVFSDSYGIFRRLLVQSRKTAGLSQSQVAQKLRRPQSYVSKYERGERRIDVVEFLEIASAIGFDPVDALIRLQKSRKH